MKMLMDRIGFMTTPPKGNSHITRYKSLIFKLSIAYPIYF